MTNPWDQPLDPNQPPPYPPPPPAGANPPPPYPPYPGPPPGYTPAMYYAPPAHPQSTTAMVLGIVGLVLCGFASPFAIWLGHKSMREIDASGGQLSGRGQAQAGFIMGIIGTALMALVLILLATGVFGAILSSGYP